MDLLGGTITRASAVRTLLPGDRVAVIGGGPAGSFAALHLLRFASQLAIPLSVTVFERKDFGRRGPAGCNKCAGILSGRAMRGLAELGLQIPEEVVQARLEGYTLHLDGRAIEVTRPDPGPPILGVYRGGGPLRGNPSPGISFDGWLLSQAQMAGATVVAANVQRVSAGPLMEVETDRGNDRFDLVIQAIGVNARPPTLEGLDYLPPRTETMAQDELGLQTPLTPAHRRRAHVYVGGQSGLIFGALIPKGEYLNLSLLGHGFEGDPIKAFLARADCTWLGEARATGLCGCRPRIAVAPARHPYGDRFVVVGDAAVTRLYKDGIGSAWATARQAAWTALHVGVSKAAFARGCAPLNRSIAWDNRLGKLLFATWDGPQNRLHQLWDRGWRRVLLTEAQLPVARRRGHRALWNMLTGDDSYAHIARNVLHPQVIGELLASLLSEMGPRKAGHLQAPEWPEDGA